MEPELASEPEESLALEPSLKDAEFNEAEESLLPEEEAEESHAVTVVVDDGAGTGVGAAVGAGVGAAVGAGVGAGVDAVDAVDDATASASDRARAHIMLAKRLTA